MTGGGASSNALAGAISGGNGGAGGGTSAGTGLGGGGGSGGVGVQFTTSGATFTNLGSVSGGAGGTGGVGGGGTGSGGLGGAGIVGSGLTIVNSGTISGGLDGFGSPAAQANAITFTGGANRLELQAGSTINGNIAVTGSLNLSQPTDATLSSTITGTGSVAKSGAGVLTLSGTNTYTGGTAINSGTLAVSANNNLGNASGGLSFDGGTLRFNAAMSSARAITLNAGGGTFNTNGFDVTLSGAIGGSGGLTKTGNGDLTLSGSNTHGGGTVVNSGSLIINGGSITGPVAVSGATTFLIFNSTGSAADAAITTSAGNGGNGGVIFEGTSTAANASITTVGGSGVAFRESSTAGNATVTISANGSGAGSGFTDTATGGTSRWINAGGIFDISGLSSAGVSIGSLEGTGLFSLGGKQLTVGGTNLSTTISGTIADGGFSGGTGGSLVKEGSGTLTLSGNNTYTGGTTVNAGTLVVNGSLAGAVTVNAGGMLGGSGTLGGLVANGATLMPGNSIGTLTINGNFAQNGGVYQVEANAAGQSDRIVATGTATIGGGATVQVIAASGNYARNTTYTILTADGGLSGVYSGVSSNFAFLTPSLSYDANNVFLTLTQTATAFASGAQTSNQFAVGTVLDATSGAASGDYLTVIDALSVLSTAQGPAALNAISGQQYADFGTTNVNTSAMFMNTLGQQMALARGASSGGQRVALAQACEVEACDTTRPLSAWFSGLGGLGSVQGNSNASTLTYNFGGAAAGIDYRLNPQFLVGLGVGYTHGTQWVNSFMGQGWSDSVSVAAYGSFTQAGFYTDALVGYAYFNNQMQRQIQIPGLPPRTANGSTGANQFLTQVETGYGLPVFGEKLTATPFARLQFSTTTQNGFNESGAQSLSLNVAQQTTNSLRTVFGAELASNLPLGTERSIGLAIRLGWQHEYADTGRPITAAFSGAPSASFTVYGATPTRDAAIIGFSANTTIAESTQLYARYDGTLASGTDNHAFTAGLRLSW